MLTYTPDALIYNPLSELTSDKKLKQGEQKPVIIDARSDRAALTNKIKALVNLKWDRDIENEDSGHIGGLNDKDIYPMLSTAIVWITYILDTEEAVEKMSDVELGKCIKHLLIDCGDNALYRTPDLKKAEKMMFGQIPF
jgi:hypothetical protein